MTTSASTDHRALGVASRRHRRDTKPRRCASSDAVAIVPSEAASACAAQSQSFTGSAAIEARFHVVAHRELKKATLVLDPGWAEGITINTIEPSPIGEASADGKIVLTLGHVPAGKSYIVFMQLQVNPTNLGRRAQNVELDDGTTPLLRIKRTVTIFP